MNKNPTKVVLAIAAFLIFGFVVIGVRQKIKQQNGVPLSQLQNTTPSGDQASSLTSPVLQGDGLENDIGKITTKMSQLDSDQGNVDQVVYDRPVDQSE